MNDKETAPSTEEWEREFDEKAQQDIDDGGFVFHVNERDASLHPEAIKDFIESTLSHREAQVLEKTEEKVALALTGEKLHGMTLFKLRQIFARTPSKDRTCITVPTK